MGFKDILPVGDKYKEVIRRTAQTAWAKGAVLKYHTDGIAMIPLAAGDNLRLGSGVAAAAVAASAQGEVVIDGVVDTLIDGTAAVAAEDPLIASAGTAGVLIKDAAVAVGDVALNVVPLAAQAGAVAAGTLTMCKVKF